MQSVVTPNALTRVARTLFSTVLVVAGAFQTAAAQESGASLTTAAPRFLAPAGAGEGGANDGAQWRNAAGEAVFQQRISLNLSGVTLEQALIEIGDEAGLHLTYSPALVRLDAPVTLNAADITVGAALSAVLYDAGVDVLLTSRTRAALIKRTDAPQQEPGTIVGSVTNVETGEPVPNAQVVAEGTGRGGFTNAAGDFRVADVPAGRQTIAVTSIGYRRSTQEIDVPDGGTITVDFTLEISPTTLAEIVVTATGEQRRVELGHVVSRINADSLVKETPVSSLSELLMARVPGLEVFTHSGQVGGKVSLQARTANSISLKTEPILIVDGVRYANDSNASTTAFFREETSRLNDINPNDIESIEVVKGPSAATLYGTDAANGVIIITTKRGEPGRARWNAYARAAQNEIPQYEYPEAYWGWGTVFGVPSSPSLSCTLRSLALGFCTQQDSITVLPHPLNDSELTIYHSKPAWEYGMNVAGGSQDLRYYFSADVEQATGPIQMPVARIEELLAERGLEELPVEQREPNARRRLTMRGNLTLALGSTAELQFNSGYGHISTRTGESSYAGNFGTRKPGLPYGDLGSSDVGDLFSRMSTEGTDRVFGSIGGQWRPVTWLQGRGTFGLDIANSERYSLERPEYVRPGTCCGPPGRAEEHRTRRLGITGDVGLSAHARLGRLSFRTAVGAQYTRQKTNVLVSGGTGLPPGGESVSQAEIKNISQSYVETATLGSYVEETIGLNDRLFVTGALRADGASNFGSDYNAAIYPKASVSWLVSEEPFLPRVPGLGELRLRYAFGASGLQPLSFMTVPQYAISNAIIDGVTTTTVRRGSVGNVDLRPERVREHEFGLDAAGLAGRIRLGLTWFRRTTTDQIVSRPVSLGFGRVYRNLGRLSARGFEADLTVRPVETPQVSWSVTLQHVFRTATVEDLGGLTPRRASDGSYVEGYPLGARFATEVLGWDDANGDGILEPAELQMSAEPVYQGEGRPPHTQTLVTSVALFQQRVRLSALLLRQSGYTHINGQGCGELCRAAVDASTPLEAQALMVAPAASFQYDNIEPADHTRLQEVTVAFDLPDALLRVVGLRTGTVSLSGRNLALWTAFSGPDPASTSVGNYSGGTSASNIPQSRTWVVRFDLGS